MNVTRQLPLTFTAQVPFLGPRSWCNSKPGKSISRALVDACKRPRIRRRRSACWTWIPDLTPVLKNRSIPLCRNPLITIVTYHVTGYYCPQSSVVRYPLCVSTTRAGGGSMSLREQLHAYTAQLEKRLRWSTLLRG